jgi:uncharacterized protein (TIGR00255 family)
MIQSMTAFARAEVRGNSGNIVCEFRSINHRYLEVGLRLPEALHSLEAPIRERIRQHITRGKVECLLRYQVSETVNSELVVNTQVADAVCAASERIAERLKNAVPINPFDVLRWPGVLQTQELDVTALQQDVLSVVDETLKNLVIARQREGEQLAELFFQRLETMKKELAVVRERLPIILSSQRERLVTRFNEAKVQVDAGRLEQELVLFAQKIDVTEEVDRLHTHVTEVMRNLKQGGVVGRRLDFLMQELNREANTLGSKSVDAETTRVSIELKVLIEQMREQVQNVE